MNHLLLTPDKLDVAAINELVGHESCGAISLFVGTTRDNFESKEVVRLEYEAYEAMALKQMEAICQETRSKWPDIHDIAVHHRLGVVPVREASVVIAISSPHRQSALNSVAYCIDELKRRVPIWKKEVYADSETAWKENKELDFDKCSVEPAASGVPEQLVQICVAEDEIKRRIGCFVQKKREEIDLNNVLDFTAPPGEATEATCARTDSVMVKQEHSKCHLRVKRVTNRCGPQTAAGNSYQHTLDKLMWSNGARRRGQPAEATATMQTHKQRLAMIESHLGMAESSAAVSVHQRLKAVEDRILFLESISPEYKHFLDDSGPEEGKRVKTEPIVGREIKREGYSVADIDTILEQLKQAT